MPFVVTPLTSLIPLLPLLPLVMSTTAPSTLPQVDFSRMGTVGLGGSFTGIDWWTPSGPFSSSSNSSRRSFSSTADTILVRLENGTYQPLGSTNDGGRISTLCWSNSSDTNGTLFIGGDFSSISGTQLSNIASYSLITSSFSSLSNGLSGPVSTLFCDDRNNQVWAGGEFSAPQGSGGNVGLWDLSTNAWTAVPFGGLNGAVRSIQASANDSSIYFGGKFTTSFASNSSLLNNNTSTTTGNITSVPSAPNGTSTTGNSGYLTPVTVPYSANQDPYVQIEISAKPSSSQLNYADPNVLVCPGQAMWLASDNTAATVDIVGVNWMRANGIRVANALVQGRGTSVFSFTSTPDNALLSLTYTDASGLNQTCSSDCPLYTNASISSQDFIFTDGPKVLTGFQMQLKEWIGAGAGLNNVQLLSDGAFGSSIPNTNKPLCPGNLPSSSAQTSGDWTIKQYTTTDPRINSYYSSVDVPIGTTDYPSVTFYPYVSSSAIYEVYITTPGCAELGDCAGRTSVDIEVYPVVGGLGYSATVSQQVQAETQTLVYTGPVDGTSDSFNPTVILSLSSNALAPQSGNTYTVVADSVVMYLVEVSGSGNSSRSAGTSVNGTSSTSSTLQGNSSVSFGVFEYVKASQNVDAATTILNNTTETALSRLGMALDAAYNASSSPSRWSVNAIATLNNTVYIAGDFAVSGNYSNVVALDTATGQSRSLAMMGLNGPVRAATVLGDSVYFGGEFTATASSGGVQLYRLAKWNPAAQSWLGLGGGVDGPVTDLSISPVSETQLIVTGNFSNTLGESSGTSGGYALFDTSSSAWVSSGLLYGNLSSVATAGTSAYLAGRIRGSSTNPVNGLAILSSADNGVASITNWPGVNFGNIGSAPAQSSTPTRRHFNSSLARSFLSRFTDSLSSRNHVMARAIPPAISAVSAPAPAVIAGAFWKNSTASGNPQVAIIGGNFTSSNGTTEIEGMAFYTEGQALSGPSPPVQGLVRALNIVGQNVYIGGEGVNVSGIGSGLVVYNLERQEWVIGGVSNLNPASGSTLSVNGIQTRADTNTVVVTGNFATAGSLTCAAVCLWDAENAQWSTPGQGLQSGEVRSMDFAGSKEEILVVAGSFAMANGDVAYVAQYSFDNSTWTPLGSLPGPALAVVVDNANATSIFAAGYSSDQTPYLQRWDGVSWTTQNSSLMQGSLVQQLAFVPLASESTAQGSIEDDRMLMLSGSLYLEDGNATSALYDGAVMHPFLVATTSSGDLGSGSSLFWSDNSFSFNIKKYLARGLVVLVAIAIATGLILLLILLFFLVACINRRRDRKKPQPETYEKAGSEISSTHQNVFNNVQAALEQSLVGGGLGVGAGAASAAAAGRQRQSDPSYYAGEGGDDEDDDDEGRETTMRYDFEGPELQPGEMAMKAGQRIIILDDVQSDEWWYARDPATGREGVVPATYVW